MGTFEYEGKKINIPNKLLYITHIPINDASGEKSKLVGDWVSDDQLEHLITHYGLSGMVNFLEKEIKVYKVRVSSPDNYKYCEIEGEKHSVSSISDDIKNSITAFERIRNDILKN